jgi:diaminohydroxyphosphoribosylaminopyrimidine deaminase/5-amino-6-(5-phosphoribosylamino)uracil reductase
MLTPPPTRPIPTCWSRRAWPLPALTVPPRPAVTEALVAEGITRLLVEGGPAVSRAFSSVGLVDDIVQYRAAGDRDATTAREDALKSVNELPGHLTFALAHERALGDDMLYVFHRMRGS